MKKFISFGKFDIKYFIIYAIYSCIIACLVTSLVYSGKNNLEIIESTNNTNNISYNNSDIISGDTSDDNLSKYYDFNILFIILINYFSQSLFFLPALIIEKLVLKKKNEKQNETPQKGKKLQIELIFNDLSKKIEDRDFIYIMATSILLLGIDYVKIFIFIKLLTMKESIQFDFCGQSSLFELIL